MITIDDAAKDYILKKGGAVTIVHSQAAALCCGRIQLAPSVELGRPETRDRYSRQTIGAVTVFFPPGFCSPHTLRIAVSSILGFKRLSLQGWKLI